MAEGIVYILTHPAMEGIVKVGRTDNLTERMRSLYNSSVPAPFTCYYAARVANMEQTEWDLHEIFGDRRLNPRREFFDADPHRVANALRMVALEELTDPTQPEPEDIAATVKTDDVTERRANLDFEMVDIPLDAELVFVEREEITCRVVNRKPARVEYQGQRMSVSAAAKAVLGVASANGNIYWGYQGETLSERRHRMTLT